MAGQRLLNIEVDERVIITVNKTIKQVDDGVHGVMYFGENNDYPQLMEKLINGSVTAKTTSNIYAKFLKGQGFENEEINNIVIGKDSRSKKITLQTLLSQVATSASKNQGYYIHLNPKLNGKIENVHLKAFKNIRFAKPDDTGYSAKLLYYDNWEKRKKEKYNKNNIKDFNTFNLERKVFLDQVQKAGGIEKYKGQIYFEFLDNEYFYPLSNYDEVYLDCDTENQIQLFKNRQIRNGFLDKIVFRIAPGGTDKEKQELVNSIKTFIGPDGETVLVLEDDLNEEGDVKESGAFRIDKIESNVNDKLFENWEKRLSNNIRKSAKNVPNLLIEIEDGIFSGQSGEAIKQATNFYNAITSDDRTIIEKSFEEIFSNFDNDILAKNTNWKIKPLNLIEQEKDGITDNSTATSD